MPQSKWFFRGLAALVAIAACAGLVYWYVITHTHQGLSRITVGDKTVYVYLADTEAKRELGLSGRESLAADEGMLFIFPIEGKPSFWMKDMKFPIDMLWIANDGSIIYIKENVSPDTYPEQFAPDTGLARYVLELPAGYSKEHGLDIGSRVEI